MKNKGFTILELLATIVIIAIISGIAIISYNSIFGNVRENYYITLEKNLLLSGSDYFESHREDLPINSYSMVSISDLINNKYITEVKDYKGNSCTSGDVFIYRDNKTNNYEYEACLRCESDNYETVGNYCQGINGLIKVDAKLKGTDIEYNPLLSYENVALSNSKSVQVTLTLSGTDYFMINDFRCDATDGVCTKEIENTGNYRVNAYNSDGKIIGDTRLLNIKIDKEYPKFDIMSQKRFIIDDESSTKNVAVEIGNVQDDFGIKEVRYCFKNSDGVCVNETQELDFNATNYKLSDVLPSGIYELEVTVIDYSGKPTIKKKDIEVSYLVKLKYNETKIEDHEVIKDKKYGFLNSLPSTYNNKTIEWIYYEDSENINDNTLVINSDTTVSKSERHTLVIKTLKAQDITDEYCLNPIYNGSNQVITKDAPEGVQFTNNIYKEVGEYPVIVKLLGGYTWSDGTDSNKTINCSILEGGSVSVSINGGDTLKSTSQNLKLKCSSNNSISGYYFGNTEPTSINDITNTNSSDINALISENGLSKNINSSGTYWFACKNTSGVYSKKSISISQYKVQSVLNYLSKDEGIYTSDNYGTKDGSNNNIVTNTYYIKSGTSLTPSNMYSIPLGADSTTYRGYTTASPSKTKKTLNTSSSITINADTDYYMWFNRKQYTVTVESGSNGKISIDNGDIVAYSGQTKTLKYKYGATVKAEAIPYSGYELNSWYRGYLSGTTNPQTGGVITANKNIFASFSKVTYTKKYYKCVSYTENCNAKPNYVTSCAPSNGNPRITCNVVNGSACGLSGNSSSQCWNKTTCYKVGCKQYSSTVTSHENVTSCTDGSDIDSKWTCTKN